MSSPARAAVAARKSPTRCSPARGCFAGRNAGLTLGSAISSRKSFSVFVMRFPGGKPGAEVTPGTDRCRASKQQTRGYGADSFEYRPSHCCQTKARARSSCPGPAKIPKEGEGEDKRKNRGVIQRQ